MERILIIGCSGSGKSRLARILGQRLGLPVIHLDQMWWKDNSQNVTREEFDSRLALALNLERWIIDGNYSRTMEARLSKCDTVIYLDFNRWACLLGVCQRILRNRGKTRPDMPAGCQEGFRWEFIRWIWNFNKNNRVQNETYLAKAKHAKAVVLKNRKEVQQFLDTV